MCSEQTKTHDTYKNIKHTNRMSVIAINNTINNFLSCDFK